MPADGAGAPTSSAAAFAHGVKTGATSVFAYVLLGTFVGYGALCHDLGFSLLWSLLSTILVWAAPAQVILVTTLGSGVPLAEAAIAVTLSAMRFLPMVAALLPVIKTSDTRAHQLFLPTHFTAASMWVEGLRLAPTLPREHRIAFCNGLGTVMMTTALVASVVGYAMAAKLPPLFAAAVLFLTPMSFLVSLVRNSRQLIDRLALAFGLVLAPALAYAKVSLGLLLAGLAAGTLAYGVHRLRRGR
ncbi:MAG TPA: AzlC family ABC transporter permease [Xanthobacteraceae bacterium]|nr:AzlC family ABC transporter permease [Xanthobacteraceae bacterium]